jgi:hypothetical protein
VRTGCGRPSRNWVACVPQVIRVAATRQSVLCGVKGRLAGLGPDPVARRSVRLRPPRQPVRSFHQHLADAFGAGVVLLVGGEDLGDMPHGPLRELPQGLPERLAERS